MPPQIACLGGYMITLVAFLRCAFSNVSSNGCVNGCIITLVAFVWLFFTVGFQMCPQSAGIKGCICSIFIHCVFSNVSSKRLHKRMDNHTGCIWKHTVEKRLTSATRQCVYASYRTSHLRTHLKTHSGEKSNKCSLCDYACSVLCLYVQRLWVHLFE